MPVAVAAFRMVDLDPVARNSFPWDADGVVKCSIAGVDWRATAWPVCGFSPYRVAWFQSVAHTSPPATIGGPFAAVGICHQASAEKVPAEAFSVKAWRPFEHVT